MLCTGTEICQIMWFHLILYAKKQLFRINRFDNEFYFFVVIIRNWSVVKQNKLNTFISSSNVWSQLNLITFSWKIICLFNLSRTLSLPHLTFFLCHFSFVSFHTFILLCLCLSQENRLKFFRPVSWSKKSLKNNEKNLLMWHLIGWVENSRLVWRIVKYTKKYEIENQMNFTQ